MSNYNKENHFSLYVTYIFSKYTWLVYLKEKRSMEISNVFFFKIDESKRKNESSEFYNKSIKLWLQDNNMKIYPRHNNT